MKQARILAVLLSIFGLALSGCTTLKESRGDTMEDIRKVIFDAREWLTNLDEKTSILNRDD